MAYGLQFGINSAIVDDHAFTESYSSKFGVYAGLIEDLKIGPSATVRIGLGYSGKGAEVRGDQITAYQRYHYLESSAVIRYTLFKPVSVCAGPYVSWLLSARLGLEGSLETDDIYANNLDAGVVGGVTVGVVQGVELGLLYEMGLVDIYEGSGRNEVVQLLVAVTLPDSWLQAISRTLQGPRSRISILTY